MHEKGRFMVQGNIIYSKTNHKIKIRNLAMLVSLSQQLIYMYGDANNNDIYTYLKDYKETFKAQGMKAFADDLTIITYSPNEGFINQDDICSLINWAEKNPNVRLIDILKESELKIKSKANKLQLYGW